MTIERHKVLEACRALGLDPDYVKNVNIDGEMVRVATYAVDEVGRRVVMGDGDYVGYACVISDFTIVDDVS